SRASAWGLTQVRADRTRLCAVSTGDLCRHTVPWKVAWFLWAAHALAACCNRHVQQAIPWLCWLKTTAHNLPFARHRRGTFRAAFVVEDWPVRVRTSLGSWWTSPASATGNR